MTLFLYYNILSVLLRAQSCNSIRDANSELLGPLHDQLPHPGRNVVSHGGSIRSVVHHKHLQFGNIRHDNSFEAMWMNIAGCFIRSVPDRGHGKGALESTADTTINALGFAPARVADAHEEIRLVASELLRSLLDNRLLIQRDWASHLCLGVSNVSVREKADSG